MSKEITHLPEDFSWYNKETKEAIIKSIKEVYGDEVTILPYIPKSLNHKLNQNKKDEKIN